MADLVEVHVESNIDRLTTQAINSAFRRLVKRVMEHGKEELKFLVPRGSTRRLERGVDTHGPIAVPGGFIGEVGIPEIDSARDGYGRALAPGAQDPAHYPLFQDRGTGIFGPTHSPIYPRKGSVMVWRDESGDKVFARRTDGLAGRHFMAQTYALMNADLEAEAKIFAAEVTALGN